MSFMRDSKRRAYLALRAPAFTSSDSDSAESPRSPARPTPTPPSPAAASCVSCGRVLSARGDAAEPVYYVRDRCFCKDHCPWIPAEALAPPAPPKEPAARPPPAKRRRVVPARDEPESPQSVLDDPVAPVSPSGSERSMAREVLVAMDVCVADALGGAPAPGDAIMVVA
mmetsp:Transcript_29412/g.87964  ORF Transcript_29412/g.87964 Transcript_29412/m.87964 type:complete len:169 (-) Transcript_29412:86-592(-)